MNPLADVSANMFSHSVGNLFILLMFSVAVQKLFTLMQSHLFIFSFVSLAQRDISDIILLSAMSEILLPVFSSRIFMVLGLMFKSLIHFEFIPVCGIKWWSSFIFLHVSDQFSQYHLLNKPSLAHCMCWLPLSILIDYKGVVLFLGSLFIPLIYVSVFMPAPYCFENKCW